MIPRRWSIIILCCGAHRYMLYWCHTYLFGYTAKLSNSKWKCSSETLCPTKRYSVIHAVWPCFFLLLNFMGKIVNFILRPGGREREREKRIEPSIGSNLIAVRNRIVFQFFLILLPYSNRSVKSTQFKSFTKITYFYFV